MGTYFLFGKYTPEGIKAMSPARTSKANKIIQKHRGKVKSIFALTGETDLVIIATFPETAQAIKSSIAIYKLTGIAFTTSEAFTVEEFDKMIGEL